MGVAISTKWLDLENTNTTLSPPAMKHVPTPLSITCLLPILCMLCVDMTVTVNLQDGATALFVASQEGHFSTVELLIKAGASLDVQDTVSFTVVMSVCRLTSSTVTCSGVCPVWGSGGLSTPCLLSYHPHMQLKLTFFIFMSNNFPRKLSLQQFRQYIKFVYNCSLQAGQLGCCLLDWAIFPRVLN